MANLTDEYKNLVFSKKCPDSSLLVPLLNWTSGYKDNITACQQINSQFFFVDKNVLSRQLFLNNKLHSFIKYPTSHKETLPEFFITDLCTYYGWSKLEFEKNREIINIEAIKGEIADSFGYDSEQRKSIGEGDKSDKRRTIKKQARTNA